MGSRSRCTHWVGLHDDNATIGVVIGVVLVVGSLTLAGLRIDQPMPHQRPMDRPEDAMVAPIDSDPVAVPVAEAGGTREPFSLSAAVLETNPDQGAGTPLPGELDKVQVAMTLLPLGPGSTIGPVPCTNGGVHGSGYDQRLTATLNFEIPDEPASRGSVRRDRDQRLDDLADISERASLYADDVSRTRLRR